MLENFSLEAQELLKNPDNWPEEAMRATQKGKAQRFTGVYFWTKDECVSCINAGPTSHPIGGVVTRAELFPPKQKESKEITIETWDKFRFHLFDVVNDRELASDNPTGPFIPRPTELSGLKFQSMGRALRLKTPAEPTLPTLITNGQWFPVYDTPGFESGLKRRGVSAERMVQLIIKSDEKSHLEAVHRHNNCKYLSGICINDQHYKWVANESLDLITEMNEAIANGMGVPGHLLQNCSGKSLKEIMGGMQHSVKSKCTAVVMGFNERMKFYNCLSETLKGIQLSTGNNLDSYALEYGLKRRSGVDAFDNGITESDGSLRARILKSLKFTPGKK